jgi:hypothetical protein
MSEQATSTLSAEQQAMIALFRRHVDAELAGDLETTMATMTDDPHLNHVASMAGGVESGSAHRYSGRCSLRAGGHHALSCLPYDAPNGVPACNYLMSKGFILDGVKVGPEGESSILSKAILASPCDACFILRTSAPPMISQC